MHRNIAVQLALGPILSMIQLIILFISYLVGSLSAEPYNVGFTIKHASVDQVNGIYVCSSDSRCSSVTASTALTLASSHSFVNGEIQKRWFISAQNGTTVTNLYGAIELACDPEIKLKTWKRLGTDAAFEPSMTITSVPSYHLATSTVTETSMEALLLDGNVLIAAYQHTALDRKSDRGRYVYSSLLYRHSLLQVVQDANILLVKLFECDYMAALGGKSRTGDCYDNIIALLSVIATRDVATDNTNINSGLPTPETKDYSALQCFTARRITSNDSELHNSMGVLSCHLHFANIRRLRHALLHQLDPLRTLHLATQNMHLLDTTVCKVWTLLALCMVGHCNNGQMHYTTDSNAISIETTTTHYNTTISLTVPVVSVVEECDILLAHLHAHGENEVVHTLFTKVCFLFRRVHNTLTNTNDAHQYRLFDSTQSYTDHSRSAINSLLSIGAMEAATVHTVHFTQSMLHIYGNEVINTENALITGLLEIYKRIEGLSLLLLTDNKEDNKSIVLQSANVKSALILSNLLRTILSNKEYTHDCASNSDLLSNFISVLFHATSPVILSLPPVVASEHADNNTISTNNSSLEYVWLQEALTLRLVLINALQQLNTMCTKLCPNCCLLLDPTSNIGGRGLFLLAYQGIGLTLEPVRILQHRLCDLKQQTETNRKLAAILCGPNRDNHGLDYVLSDKTVPQLYAQLIQRTTSQKIEEFIYTSNANVSNKATITTSTATATTNTTYSNTPHNSSKIKVGFVSFFFRRHPVGRLLSKIITQLGSSLFDVYLIVQSDAHQKHGHTTTKPDPVTQSLHVNLQKINILRIPRDENTALTTLRAENFDVIVYGDVFMDAFIAHLAMFRIGKVQVSFWGHPYTSGYESMDYFISSDRFESQRDKHRYQHYQEQLVLFDSLSFQLLLEKADTNIADGNSGTPNSEGTTVYNALPSYIPRSVYCIWNQTYQVDASSSISSVFYTRRKDVLNWITSIGYDVYDMPVSDTALCKALLGSRNSTYDMYTCANGTTSATTVQSIIERVHLYGALQSLFKMHPMFDLAIYYILLRDPHAIILLSRNGKQTVWEENFRTRLVTTITTQWDNDKTLTASAGKTTKPTLDAILNRVIFVNQMQHIQYEQLVCSVDITLDTFPFGGGVTLSDGLGGCGAHMKHTYKPEHNKTHTKNNISECAGTHYISPIVPFVTSGQLQSVHQIGAGIASKLSPNISNFAYSIPEKEPKEGIVNSVHNVATLRADVYDHIYTTHMHYIREYATVAVATATGSHRRKMYTHDTCDQAHKDMLSAEEKIKELLYDNIEAAQEWSDFLKRIALHDYYHCF